MFTLNLLFSPSLVFVGNGDAGRGHVSDPGPQTAHGSWQRPEVHAQRRQPNHRHRPGHRNPPHVGGRQIQLGLREMKGKEETLWDSGVRSLLDWSSRNVTLELNYGPVYIAKLNLFAKKDVFVLMCRKPLKNVPTNCLHEEASKVSLGLEIWNNLCPFQLCFHYPLSCLSCQLFTKWKTVHLGKFPNLSCTWLVIPCCSSTDTSWVLLLFSAHLSKEM